MALVTLCVYLRTLPGFRLQLRGVALWRIGAVIAMLVGAWMALVVRAAPLDAFAMRALSTFAYLVIAIGAGLSFANVTALVEDAEAKKSRIRR